LLQQRRRFLVLTVRHTRRSVHHSEHHTAYTGAVLAFFACASAAAAAAAASSARRFALAALGVGGTSPVIGATELNVVASSCAATVVLCNVHQCDTSHMLLTVSSVPLFPSVAADVDAAAGARKGAGVVGIGVSGGKSTHPR
jgi:hypothetical protein